MPDLTEIRIHGRGGQGNVVAAYVLATAAFEAGRYCQAFPAFGAERRGAPVAAFVRMGDRPISRRNQVSAPDHLIVQDESLMNEPGLLDGLTPGGGILVNSNATSEVLGDRHGRDMVALPATRLAVELLGRPIPNVALLAAFLSLTELLPLTALEKALAERFSGEVLKRNLALVRATPDLVPGGLWKEARRAASA